MIISTRYDTEADVLHLSFGAEDVRSDTSEEIAPGAYLEVDSDANAVGLELTSVSLSRGLAGTVQPMTRAGYNRDAFVLEIGPPLDGVLTRREPAPGIAIQLDSSGHLVRVEVAVWQRTPGDHMPSLAGAT